MDWEYSLRDSEVRTLTDLGKFRVVPADDLARFAYHADRSQMETDIRSLSRHGLVEQRSIEGHSSYSTKVLTLTKDGHRLLERAQLVSHRQATYHGLVKPKEARHDADLYRLYHKVAREIERSGGKVRRVVLDFELKKDLYQALFADAARQRAAIRTNLHCESVRPESGGWQNSHSRLAHRV